MPSIHAIIGEETVRQMDLYVFGSFPDAEGERMRDFTAGRNAAAHIFTELGVAIPSDLLRAAQIVREKAANMPFADDKLTVDSEEFALGATWASYMIKRQQELIV